MRWRDEDVLAVRAGVNCATVLEKLSNGWELDKRGSTRRNPKYRRANGDTLIINHGGEGWWDPKSQAKGNVFGLVRHLDPSRSFGDALRILRDYVGIAPSLPLAPRCVRPDRPPLSPDERWGRAKPLRRGSPVWNYLTGERALPAEVLLASASAHGIREGSHANAWFAHRDEGGQLTGFEMRGTSYRGFSTGGSKTLFRWVACGLAVGSPRPRLAVLEAPIDVLSMAVIEGLRTDTLYVSTTGGMGPKTVLAIRRHLKSIASVPGAVLIAATDADDQGHRYAEALTGMAAIDAVPFERLLPPDGKKDWNDVLKARAARASALASGFAQQPA